MAGKGLLSEVYTIRRERLGELVREYGKGKHAEFVRMLSERLNRAEDDVKAELTIFENASYISRALQAVEKGRKNIGEGPAMAFESLFEKPTSWMSKRDADLYSGRMPLSPLIENTWQDMDTGEKKEAVTTFERVIKGFSKPAASSGRRRAGG